MICKTYKANTYNIYTIKTDKFKTCHMEIVFRNNIDKNDITLRSVLTEMIVENTKKYNTRRKMMIELENLYNAYFYGVTNRVGSSVITSFCFDFIDPSLVKENALDFIKFPLEAVLNPNVKNNEFDLITLEYVKERVKKDIESIIEDPKNYSISKLLEKMCPDTESSININGYTKDLDKITPETLYNFYINMIKHDYIDVYIIGNLDMDKISNIIKNNFKVNILKNHGITYNINNKIIKKSKKLYESFSTSQENICIGLNIKNETKFEKNYVANIYNMILGGGSLESILYKKLRNENSLCYNCVSLYQKFDNLFIIHTAISKENETLAIKLIKESLKDMSSKKIKDEDLENAKKLILTNLNSSLDVPGRIIDNYIFKNLYDLDDLETRINNYKLVTKEDIIAFAKKIKINTILCVRDGENEKDNN